MLMDPEAGTCRPICRPSVICYGIKDTTLLIKANGTLVGRVYRRQFTLGYHPPPRTHIADYEGGDDEDLDCSRCRPMVASAKR